MKQRNKRGVDSLLPLLFFKTEATVGREYGKIFLSAAGHADLPVLHPKHSHPQLKYYPSTSVRAK